MPTTPQQISPEDLARVDPWYWAYGNSVQLQSGPFLLKGHEYLIGPMQSDARVRVMKKGAQLGFTEIEVIKTLHGQIMGFYTSGVLYLFPTSDDVSDFAKARFNPLIQDNPGSIGSFVQSTDSTNIKRIGKGMLYLRGAKATQKVEGLKKDASKLRSIPVDKTVFDEVDLMDPDMVQMALERMSHSHVQEETYLSTPTIPNYGIDALYEESDRRIWVIKCKSCGRDCCLELDFPECVKYKDNKAYRACVKCGGELNPSDGEWVKRNADREIAGWWISQLNSTYINPGKILELFLDPPNGNVGEVYNSKLGMAYIAAENRLTHRDVYDCCGPHAMGMKSNGPCAMGVDVGRVLHVVIGKKVDNTRKEIVWLGEVPDFGDLYELAERFNVRSAAVDYYPETRAARAYQGGSEYPVYLCEYKENVDGGSQRKEDVGLIKVGRTEICDTTHNAIIKGKYILPRRNEKVETYAAQMSALVKVLEEDKVRGTKVYRYRKLEADHYRHATNYFEIASQNIGMASDDPIRDMVKRLADAQSGYAPLDFGMGGNDVFTV